MENIPALLMGSVERAPWGWALTVIVIGYLIKQWPVLQLQAINARAQLRGEKRDDLDDCKTALALMRTDLDGAIGRIHQLEMKLVSTATAYRIGEARLAEIEPDGSALHQMRAVFQEIWDIPSFGAVALAKWSAAPPA